MDLSQLDDDAVRATQRLIKQGYEAYLVGGCVRDLLLGREPKDYDIATEARPQQVKRVFPRNCRIIGRRFKLAHLHFHGNTKILECSTFRRSPQQGEPGDDVLITRDNEFGNAEEDALRRDFTVNALFLDPTRDTILDYTNGLQDLHARVIRTIGDPRVRFREDPVRILRAAKFAGRLGFTVEPETFAAMAETSCDLVRSAPPRLFEEILRLLRSGHSLDSFQLLRDVGALKCLAPVVADFLASAEHERRVDFWRVLDALDQHIQDGHRPNNGVLLGTLLVAPVLAKVERNPGRSPSSIAEEMLSPFCAALRLPRRDAGCVKRICGVQHRFAQNDDEKRFRTAGFLHGPYFLEALELFELRSLAGGLDLTIVDRWKDLAADAFGEGGPRDDAAPDEEGNDETGEEEAARDAAPDGADEGEPGEPEAADVALTDEATRDTDAAGEAGDEDAAPPTDADVAEPATSSNPWEQPAEPGRRRRRRRRRRGGQRDDQDAPRGERPEAAASHAGEAPEGDLPAATPLDDGDAADAPLSVRTPRIAPDFLQPEGAEDDSDVDVDRIAEGSGPAGEPATAQAQRAHPADAEGGDVREPGRRRRRRRRRRGGGGGEPFPLSDAPAPHGEAVDADRAHHEPPHDDAVVRDPGAPSRDTSSDESSSGEAMPDDAAGEPAGAGATADAAGHEVDAQAPGERRGRRRRRRRGRGRGAHPDDQQQHPGDGPDARAPQLQPQPSRAHGQPNQPRQRDARGPHDQRQRDQRPHDQRQHEQRQHDQRPNEQRPHDQRPQQEPRTGDRGNRRDRHRDRDRDRNRPRHGAPRDVDVVPRYRDRRGKVDVIEPAALDLSAFDVELDPKRVPTFGSIVEGKGRPKRRSPRVPEDGVDDYKPPPPPGGSGGPAPPPPSPTNDSPDTFGDW